MSRLISSFSLMLSLVAGALVASTAITFATGAFETAGNVRWIVFASRQNVDEAIGAGNPRANDDYPLAEAAGLSIMSILADCCAGETRARITDQGHLIVWRRSCAA